MSTPSPLALDRQATPWLFLSALATTLPHFAHQPYWLSALNTLLLSWGGFLWWRDRRLPGRWILLLLVFSACSSILIEYRTLFGRDAGVGMLVIFMGMKLLELRSRRDGMVVIALGYFLLLTHYLYSQTMATGAWLLAALWLLTATLIRLHGGPVATVRHCLRYAAMLCLQATPFMLTLFVLFPRISGPLWGLPQDAHAGRTGLSDTMAPGSISQLAQSAEIAFRVRFDGPPPPPDTRYWRGPVMEQFDGKTWRPAATGTSPASIERLSAPIPYELTLEPHNQRWLLALDAPTTLPEGAQVDAAMSVLNRTPITQRQRIRMSASLDYHLNRQEARSTLARNLALPANLNPRARALGERWRRAEAHPEAVVARALALFRENAFFYTLQPPPLGENGIDDFLFTTQRGFCEHYAAAFVTLMRAAGIPARVVGGYQGGERNPLDGYLVVRQSDAHAWSEVWLEGKGWIRIDPTAAVAPNRIDRGIAEALPPGDPLPALIQVRADWLRGMRHRWEALNNAWNQHILGYDPQRQRELLSRLGLPDPDWRDLALLLGAACALLLAGTSALILIQRSRLDPIQRLWRKALRQLARRQVHCAPWETPLMLAARVEAEHPEIAPAVRNIVEAYLLARYAAPDHNEKKLRGAIARLPRRRFF